MVVNEFMKTNDVNYATVKGGRGFLTSFLASGRVTEETIKNYDVKKAKKYLKKHEKQTEIVDTMYRCSKRYAESMSAKKYEVIAAICIVQGVKYIGCEQWNERLAKAMKKFEINDEEDNDEKTKDYDPDKIAQQKKKSLKIVKEYIDEIISDDFSYEIDFEAEDGLFELTVSNSNDNTQKRCYLIDPYVIHGNDIFLMDSSRNAIPFFKENVVEAVINGKEFTKQNLDEIAEFEFEDKELYNIFDLSNCKKLNKMNLQDYHMFEKKLLKIKEELQKQYPTISRTRINKYIDNDSFCLISDKFVTNNRFYSGIINEKIIIRIEYCKGQIIVIEE